MARRKSKRGNGCVGESDEGFRSNKKQVKEAVSEDESSEVWNPSLSPHPSDTASSYETSITKTSTLSDGTRCGLKSKNVKKKETPGVVRKKEKCSTKAGVTKPPRDNGSRKALADKSNLAYYCVEGERVLEGYKQGNGIFCSFCNRAISPFSQFVAHAGWAVKRRPYRQGNWFWCSNCYKIQMALQKLVDNGVELIPSSILQDTIKEKHNAETDTFQWQILSGGNHCLEHLPVLSGANELFKQCFSPIVAGSGPNLIPVMVYGREIPDGQNFVGMYCVVMIVNSELVSAGLVRIFGPDVAELPLVATSKQHQGKGYFQATFSCIENLLSSLNVENIVLPAAEKAQSFWTQKLGFQRMSEERLLNYSEKYLHLTTFKGTSMLEKKVKQQQ